MSFSHINKRQGRKILFRLYLDRIFYESSHGLWSTPKFYELIIIITGSKYCTFECKVNVFVLVFLILNDESF